MSDYEELKAMLESRKAANWLSVDCLSIKQLLGLITENERLQAKTGTTMGVGSGDGRLFVHGDYDSIKAAQAIVLERDQLKAEVARSTEREILQLAEIESLRKDVERITDHIAGGMDSKAVAIQGMARLTSENEKLRNAVNYAAETFGRITSADGSGHADLSKAVLRIAGSAMN
jgi:hypothetical protein